MNKKLIIISAAFAMLALTGVAAAVITSYGTISGAATVKSAIGWDILTSYSDVSSTATNDTHYVLETAYQGDVKWVKIKILNYAEAAVPVNVSIVNDRTSDVTVVVLDENKSQELANPISVPSTDMYIWLKHVFSSGAEPGNYSFSISFVPG